MEGKVIILTWFVQSSVYKEVSKVKVDLSAKVAHIGVPSTYWNIVFSETTWPIETKFHMTTPYDLLAKTYTNCYGHVTKMATTP